MRRLALLLVALAVLAAPARASYEQFANFEVMAPEVDDESAFDYVLARPIDAWRDEWEAATSAIRADEGCMTASFWYQCDEFKARAPLGERSWLDVDFLEHDDPAGSYQWLQFDFMHATRAAGAWGVRFRPASDKSAQDFAALWTTGDGRAPFQARLTLTIEDTFNRLWTFRQAQTGAHHWEPYHVHPFEPAFEIVSRGAHHHVLVSGTWLTPSSRSIVDPDPLLAGSRTLRGTHALLDARRDDGPWTTLARFEHTAARSTVANLAQPGDGREDRTAWTAEVGVHRVLRPRVRLEAGYLYMRRSEDWRPPVASGSFGALDRVGHLQVAWRFRPDWAARCGLLYDRTGVATSGAPPEFTWGTRKAARAILGLEARFGRVRVQGTEGIQLGSKPYPVAFHHDKGFVHLQTTF